MLPSDLGYSAQDIVTAWDMPNWRFLCGLGIGSLCFYLYYVEAIRCGWRDRCAGMPWQTNMYNTAHDSVYILSFANWFTVGAPTYHILAQIFWFGIVFWFFMELVVHYHTIKWSRREMFPMVPASAFLPVYLGCQGFLFLMMMWMRVTLDDPFFYILIATTYTGCLLFNFHFLYRRGSRKGQSQLLVWSLAFTPVGFWFFCLPAISPRMDNIWTYLFGLANCALSFGYALYYQTFPAREAETASASAAAFRWPHRASFRSCLPAGSDGRAISSLCCNA